MKLSIIIPVYNEEKTIKQILEKVNKVKLSKKIKKEILVVNDNSSDNTVAILNQVISKQKDLTIIHHSTNQGKGSAVRTGLFAATGNIFIIQDADLEYDPNDYPRLLKPILSKKAQVVYGSRFINYPLKLWGKDKTILPINWIGNKLLTYLFNLLYGSNITDMETCYKVFDKEVFNGLTIKSKRFDIEPEITAKVVKKGYKILEIPIRVNPRTYQEGKKITWKDGIVALGAIFKYRFID